MSKAGYKRNERVYWNVLCTYTSGGKLKKYVHRSFNQSYTGSLEDAKKTHAWGNHPTFKTKVIGIRFE